MFSRDRKFIVVKPKQIADELKSYGKPIHGQQRLYVPLCEAVMCTASWKWWQSSRDHMASFCTNTYNYVPNAFIIWMSQGFIPSTSQSDLSCSGRRHTQGKSSQIHECQARLTFATYTNATETHIHPLFFIGKFKNPKRFKLVSTSDKLNIWYRNQTNFLMQFDLFEYCWLKAGIQRLVIRFVWY